MKKITSLICLLLIGIAVQAQTKAAKANQAYLYELVIPNYEEKAAKFLAYHDSIRRAVSESPQVKKLIEDSKKANSTNQDDFKAAQMAIQQLNQLNERLEYNKYDGFQKEFSDIQVLSDAIRNVLAREGYSLAFLYEASDIKDVIFKDNDAEYWVNKTMGDCAGDKREAAGLKRMINITESTKEEQKQYNQFRQECQAEIVNGLAADSVDITELVQKELGK